ncbi:MAG: sugar ABC transporter permease [Hungatella sp.]|nr:sugar ABC transporter permease [Hungatella sp.]
MKNKPDVMQVQAKQNKRKTAVAEFMLVLPALALYGVFVVYPLFGGIFYSLTDWDGVRKTFNFIGAKNYIDIMHDSYVLEPLKNTFIYAFFNTIILNCLGLLMAIGAESVRRGRNVFRALLYIPSVLSAILVGFVFNFIFDKSLGALGKQLGIEVMANNLLGSKSFALAMGILVTSWKSAGWYMVVYIAGLHNIDQSLYDAASVDGVTGWKRFCYVTFPLLAPSFTINMVLAVERSFKQYDLLYALTGGGPGRASELISMTIYNECFTNKRAGYGTALGIILFLIIVVITLFQMKVLGKREENAR